MSRILVTSVRWRVMYPAEPQKPIIAIYFYCLLLYLLLRCKFTVLSVYGVGWFVSIPVAIKLAMAT
jgi:hypothetical protein